MSASEHGGGSRLRRLDDAVVPRLQRAARAAARFAGSPLRGIRRWEQGLAAGRPERFLWRHRQGLVLTVALIAFAGSWVHLQRYPDLTAQGDPPPPLGSTTDPGSAGPALAGGAVVVGPADGQELTTYIEERRDAVSELEDDEARVAVVSFEDYLTPEEAADVVPDELSPLALQLRLPDPQMEPFEVDVDSTVDRVAADALRDERERIAEEEAEFEELLSSGTVEDEDFVAEFREQVERLKAVRNLLDTGAGTVFAVVVRGPTDELKDLADDDRVRLVDPAPAEIEVDASSFFGLLPDDEETASYGSIA